MQAQFEASGIPVLALGMLPSRPSAMGMARFLYAITQEPWRPDLVQGWMYHGNMAAQLAGTLLSAPVVWNIRHTLHAFHEEPPHTAFIIRLGAWLSGLPDAIVCNSPTSYRMHVALGYRDLPWTILPNGFELERFCPNLEARTAVRAELGITPQARVVGLVARYHSVKDHDTFLKAAALVARIHPDVRFLLIGPGVDEGNAELLENTELLGLIDRVHLLGARTDLPALTNAMDVAVSSSKSEAFSNALGEALACGVPCVATDVGESRIIVGDAGRLVPPGNPEAMGSALDELLRLGEAVRRELGEAGRLRIVRDFSMARVAEKYQRFYESFF
jgi:glycosyltransferase involved in cell wall biosynthesis